MFKIEEKVMKEVTVEEVLDALRYSQKAMCDDDRLSEKAKKIKEKLVLVAGNNQPWFDLFSELIDEKIEPDKSAFLKFQKFTPIVPLKNVCSHSYTLNSVIFYCGSGSVFYNQKGGIGNSMDQKQSSWRFATEDEVRQAFKGQ